MTAVAFSPDGVILASGAGLNDTIGLWDARTGAPRHTLTGHDGPVMAVACSPDGATLASIGGLDRTIRLWSSSPDRSST